MPTYEYKCRKCGKEFEYFQSIKDDALQACPDDVCEQTDGKGEVFRKISKNVGLIFNGSGFYLTDYVHNKASQPNHNGDKSSNASDGGSQTNDKGSNANENAAQSRDSSANAKSDASNSSDKANSTSKNTNTNLKNTNTTSNNTKNDSNSSNKAAS